MNNPNIITFLQEFLQRLFTKSPKFFKIWSLISGTLVLITGLPDLINSLPFHTNIPDLWNDKITLVVAWASRGILIMSLLTTKSPAVGVSTDGKVVKATDDKQLPFTAAAEAKSAVKHELPIVEVKAATDTTNS